MYDGSVRKSLGSCHLQVGGRTEGQQLILQGDEKQPPFTFVIGHMSDPKSSLLQSRNCRQQVLEEFDDVFGGLGSLPVEYDIEVDEMVPAVQNRPCKIPHTMKEAVENKLTQLVDLGVIAPMDAPTEDLNKAIRRNHFYMPTIDDVLPKLKGAKNFSVLDAKDEVLTGEVVRKEQL
ncbi:hypothetical protein EMCRGX_G014836 [Ephydatia muelleri]